MNPIRILAYLLAALFPVLAAGQPPAFKDFREALTAADQALRAKKGGEAVQYAKAALALTGSKPVDRAMALDRLAQAHTALEQWKELIGAVKADVMACADYSQAHQSLRACATSVARAAIKSGDLETFKGLVARLARQPVTDATFALWRDAAMILAQDAVDLRGKKAPAAADAKAGMAGFREGGTTFGLWQQPLEIDGEIVLDATRLAEAEQLLTRQMPQSGLPPKFQFLRDRALLDIQVLSGSEAGRSRAYAVLQQRAFAFRPADHEGENALEEAFGVLLNYHEKRLSWLDAANAVNARVTRRPDTVGNRLPTLIGQAAGYYFRAGADRLHEAERARLAALPFSDEVFKGYMEMATIISRDHQACPDIPRLLKPVVDRRPSLKAEQRYTLAGWLLDTAIRMNDVKAAKENMAELVGLDAACTEGMAAEEKKVAEARAKGGSYQRQNFPRTVLQPHHRHRYASLMLSERALPEAIEAYSRCVAIEERNPHLHLGLAIARMLAGQEKAARDGLEVFVANTALRAESRFAGRVIQAVVDAADLPDFKRRVMALRSLSDAEAVAGEKPDAAEARFFNWLRSATRQVFGTEKVDHVLALQECTESLKHPEIRLDYTARYLENAPTSAESWMRSGLFADESRVERRFGRYGMFSSINKAAELALLKSHPAPTMGDYNKGEEGGVIFAYDERGVHVYVQFNDPASRAMRDGLRPGVSLELTISPGDAYSYHQTFYSTTDGVDTVDIEWDAVHEGYKMTRDYVRNDCCQTEKATAGYTFLPWILFHDKLPKHGDKWRLLVVAGWASQFRSLGGGSVHELGRSLRVTFDMPPAIAGKIRQGVVKAAVGEYRRIRRQWENAGFWSDPHLGDESFAERVVKPFLQELDDAAATVEDTSKPLAQAEYDRLFKERVPKWADFRLKLDALRANDLEEQFFR